MSLPQRPELSLAGQRVLAASRRTAQPELPPIAETVPDVPVRDESPAIVDEHGPERGQSWRPLDLTRILRGEHKRPEPDAGLRRADGLRLLYRGKEHSVIGEMESGKSWFCLACAAAELRAGNHVVYIHFEEADPADTVERLQMLDVPDESIVERFRFVGPHEPVNAEWLAALLVPAPSLVVLDGVNEAMSLHGQGIRDEDGAAAFRRRLVKPCTARGAAVLSADHVVKDRDRRDGAAIGTIHKSNGLTGSLILLENATPFGRGRRGCSHVFVTKDRPGYLRRHGQPTSTPRKTFMGSLIVDDVRGWQDYLDLVFTAPQDQPGAKTDRPTRDQEDDEHILAVVAKLTADEHGGVSLRTVRDSASPLGRKRAEDAVNRLALDGRLAEEKGLRNARLFSVAVTP
jgi:hypothetical protein